MGTPTLIVEAFLLPLSVGVLCAVSDSNRSNERSAVVVEFEVVPAILVPIDRICIVSVRRGGGRFVPLQGIDVDPIVRR
jgi:flagellar biosynthesis/type III secretory pathway ATPase